MKKLGVLVALLTLTACGGGNSPNLTGAPVSVKLATIQEVPLEDTSDFIATLNSRQSVTLKPRVSGQISQILVRQGEQSASGAPLLVIDPSSQAATVQSNEAAVATAQAEVTSREAALQSARAGLESSRALLSARQASRLERLSSVALQRRDSQRDRELYGAGVISRRELENRINSLEIAEAALKSLDSEINAQQSNVSEAAARILEAEANLNSARQRLEASKADTLKEKVQLQFHQISAPFAGKVGSIPVKVGDFVSSTTELLTLTQDDQLEVEVSIPVERASQLREGLSVKIIDAQNSVITNGKVFFISPTVSGQNQSVLVKAAIDNADKKLRQDQLVQVRMVWNTRSALQVPTSAVLQQAGKSFVFVAETTKPENSAAKRVVKQRPITLGKITGNAQEVVAGLKPQEQVVVSGVQFLNDGVEIAVSQSPEKL